MQMRSNQLTPVLSLILHVCILKQKMTHYVHTENESPLQLAASGNQISGLHMSVDVVLVFT